MTHESARAIASRRGRSADAATHALAAGELAADIAGFDFTFKRPGRTTAGLVANYWEVRGDFHSARDRMLPSDQVAIVFNLGAPVTIIGPGSDERALSGSWICGAQLAPLVTASPAGTWICGARLTHRGAFVSLGLSPRELTGNIVDLADCWGPASTGTLERLRSAASRAERFAIIGEQIARASQLAPDWNSAVEHAVRSLRASRGSSSVRSLADEIDWSRQWLHRAFADFLGVSPKTMARIQRFSHAVDLIGFAGDVDLASVANGAGYYDQAHFTRDFSEFSGLTPGDFLRKRRPDAATGFA